MKRLLSTFLLCFTVAAVGDEYNTVAKTNTNTGSSIYISGFLGPSDVAIDAAENKAFVCNFVGESVSVINTSTNATTDITDPSLTAPYNIAIDTSLHKAFVCNRNFKGLVTVIDTTNNTVLTSISLGLSPSDNTFPQQIAYGSNGYVYICDSFLGLVAVNTTNYAVYYATGSADLLELPKNASGITVDTTNNLAFFCYKANGVGPDGVGVVDITTPTAPVITGIVDDPNQSIDFPSGIAFGGVNSYIYVTNRASTNPNTGSVTVINPNTEAVVSTIPNIVIPIGIAISGDFAYVCNFGKLTSPTISCNYPYAPVQTNSGGGSGSTVTVIDTTGDVVTDTYTGYNSPQAVAVLAGSPDILYVCNGGEPQFSCFLSFRLRGSVNRKTLYKETEGLYSPSSGLY